MYVYFSHSSVHCDIRWSSPIGEGCKLRIHDGSPRWETGPNHHEGEYRWSDSGNGHILDGNVSYTGHNGIRWRSYRHVEGETARQRRREHKIQRVDFNGDCHFSQYGQHNITDGDVGRELSQRLSSKAHNKQQQQRG